MARELLEDFHEFMVERPVSTFCSVLILIATIVALVGHQTERATTEAFPVWGLFIVIVHMNNPKKSWSLRINGVLMTLGITLGCHRYFSHRQFEGANVPCELGIYGLCAYSMQSTPFGWAKYHRHHHAWTDTENDIHSTLGPDGKPTVQAFWSAHNAIIWKEGVMGRGDASNKHIQVDGYLPDLACKPHFKWLENYVKPSRTAMVIGGAHLAIGGTVAFTGYLSAWVLTLHGAWCINSLFHLGTERVGETTSTAINIPYFFFPFLGDEYHANHHLTPFSAANSREWYEFDAGYALIRLGETLGIFTNVQHYSRPDTREHPGNPKHKALYSCAMPDPAPPKEYDPTKLQSDYTGLLNEGAEHGSSQDAQAAMDAGRVVVPKKAPKMDASTVVVPETAPIAAMNVAGDADVPPLPRLRASRNAFKDGKIASTETQEEGGADAAQEEGGEFAERRSRLHRRRRPDGAMGGRAAGRRDGFRSQSQDVQDN